MAESKKELKNSPEQSERWEWESWLKTQHSKNEDHAIVFYDFMVNTSRKKWKQWQTIFLGSETTVDDDWSQENKRHLLFGRKLMTNHNSILKSRDITLPTIVCIVKAVVFPVVRYGCESWTIKKAGQERIDAFELWCWRRILRVPWTTRRSNQSILKEISPKYSLEGLMLKLKL